MKVRAAIEWAVRPYAGKIVTAELRTALRVRLTTALSGFGIENAVALRDMKTHGFVIASEYSLIDPIDIARTPPP